MVVSARPAHGYRERALKAGASAFLQKPVDNDLLLRTIREVLGEVPAETVAVSAP